MNWKLYIIIIDWSDKILYESWKKINTKNHWKILQTIYKFRIFKKEYNILWKYSICHKIATWRQVAQSGSMWLNVPNYGSHIRSTLRHMEPHDFNWRNVSQICEPQFPILSTLEPHWNHKMWRQVEPIGATFFVIVKLAIVKLAASDIKQMTFQCVIGRMFLSLGSNIIGLDVKWEVAWYSLKMRHYKRKLICLKLLAKASNLLVRG